MNNIGTLPIQTKRLLLRPFKKEDASSMFRNYCSDEEVTKYLTWNKHENVQQTEAFLLSFIDQYQTNTHYQWAICQQEMKDEVIGSIDLRNKPNDCMEVGYVLGKTFWNQGYMTEAFKAIIDYFFCLMKGKTILAYYELENIASKKVMLACGLTPIDNELRFTPKVNKQVILGGCGFTLDQYNELIKKRK